MTFRAFDVDGVEIEVGDTVEYIRDSGGDCYTVSDCLPDQTISLKKHAGSFYSNCYRVIKKKEKDMNKTFTKDMLKTGMRVVDRKGATRIVMKGVDDSEGYLIGTLWSYLKNYKSDLTDDTGYAGIDIMKVYAAPDVKTLMLSIGEKGSLLWKREEKTKEELIKEQRIVELEQQAKELAQTIQKLKEGK